MKVKIDEDKCIGCGACASICEDTFGMDHSKGKAKLKRKEIKNDTYEKDAANACPVGAIQIYK